MSESCEECQNLRGREGFARNDLGHLRGRLRRAWEPDLPRLVELTKKATAKLRQAEQDLAEHEAECPIALLPRKIVGVRRKAAPKPKREKRVVEIDHEAMAAALVVATPKPSSPGRNMLPATGRCHECDRLVSGERRYCGPCLARRM